METEHRNTPMQQIILVRNTETRKTVHTEACEKSALSPQRLAQVTARKAVALEDRYVGTVSSGGRLRHLGRRLPQSYPEYRLANWRAVRSPR